VTGQPRAGGRGVGSFLVGRLARHVSPRLSLNLHDLKLFDWVPLGYVVDAMDACVLVVFLAFAVIDAVSVFRD
jgi:hypothetical protein